MLYTQYTFAEMSFRRHHITPTLNKKIMMKKCHSSESHTCGTNLSLLIYVLSFVSLIQLRLLTIIQQKLENPANDETTIQPRKTTGE